MFASLTSKRFFILISIAALAVSGCGLAPANGHNADSMPSEPLAAPSQEHIATHTPDSTPKGDTPKVVPTLSAPFTSNLQQLIEKAKEDLTQRLSVSVTQINLVEATEVVWSDSSLGCPQKGMVYTDVLTPGYLIILSANNMEYEYHSSKGSELVYCENPNPPVQGMPGDT